ncbi:hypothetical protein GUITHDRAFT_113838 [Guillardia theta CCMP2712]|uniref:Glycosyltransferase family 92 protein n=1 Tax=Guillardia theta (strain CCMP2712) TaxID=905079 RepID=L1IW78_GUITC|nr:hypothetical protein GUITHDRAFT_113838 [Guillardia theta CCMP2712]EKX40100.1 hypothetical protein GUITHDRAFT_113838 [Guillardia theta CCMP2712]|eukprot:XP_005827080.1 hypothetical protein GUITHDRAFT_113838 [Guillardia theta CCMP2712]
MQGGMSAVTLMLMLAMLSCLSGSHGVDEETSITRDDTCNSDSCSSESIRYEFQVAACTIFRDEDRFLSEWPSDFCFQEILQPYVASGLVTVAQAVNVRDPQIPTYNLCVERYSRRARWLAFIDVDEFLFPSNSSQTLPEVLERFVDYGGVVVPWTLFGSSGHIRPPQGLVIESYTQRRAKAECNGDTCAYKVIAQGERISACDVHNHYYKDGYFAVNEQGVRMHDDSSLLPTESEDGDFTSNLLRLHHYKTKSLADAMWKHLNKDGVNAQHSESLNPKTRSGIERWFQSSDYNEVQDESALAWLPCVRRTTSRMRMRMSREGQECEHKVRAEDALETAEKKEPAGSSSPEVSSEAGRSFTLVSAYYPVPSKRAAEVYEQWMMNFFEYVESPIVVFTNAMGWRLLEKLRLQRENVKVLMLEMQDFFVYKWKDDFVQHYEMDDEKYHSPELYMVWNEKTSFLLRVIEMNPFKSPRLVSVLPVTAAAAPTPFSGRWPSSRGLSKIPQDKIVLLQIEPFTPEEMTSLENLGPDYSPVRWGRLFYNMVDSYIKRGRFAGKDQNMFATVCLFNPDICHLVSPPPTHHDHWMYLKEYLRD